MGGTIQATDNPFVRKIEGVALVRLSNAERDALGITPVHVNRVLTELRDAGLVTFACGRLTVHDRAALETAPDFNPTSLPMRRTDERR